MITIGSVSRENAAQIFPFLAPRYSGRRAAIKAFTHRDPDYVFWIYPDGRLFNARDAHRNHLPHGYDWIIDDEPDYGGFLRGRVASHADGQLIVIYCRPEALVSGAAVRQFLAGLLALPIPLREDALIISDNGDMYGTIDDVMGRAR